MKLCYNQNNAEPISLRGNSKCNNHNNHNNNSLVLKKIKENKNCIDDSKDTILNKIKKLKQLVENNKDCIDDNKIDIIAAIGALTILVVGLDVINLRYYFDRDVTRDTMIITQATATPNAEHGFTVMVTKPMDNTTNVSKTDIDYYFPNGNPYNDLGAVNLYFPIYLAPTAIPNTYIPSNLPLNSFFEKAAPWLGVDDRDIQYTMSFTLLRNSVNVNTVQAISLFVCKGSEAGGPFTGETILVETWDLATIDMTIHQLRSFQYTYFGNLKKDQMIGMFCFGFSYGTGSTPVSAETNNQIWNSEYQVVNARTYLTAKDN